MCLYEPILKLQLSSATQSQGGIGKRIIPLKKILKGEEFKVFAFCPPAFAKFDLFLLNFFEIHKVFLLFRFLFRIGSEAVSKNISKFFKSIRAN